MRILGPNAFHGDASAALLRDGQLVAALEEERLNRIKHWAGLHVAAGKARLEGARPDYIAISRNPKAHLMDKLVRTFGPDLSSPVRISAGGYIKRKWGTSHADPVTTPLIFERSRFLCLN